MSKHETLQLNTVVEEIQKRLNRLPGNAALNVVRTKLQEAVDKPTEAKVLIAEAIEAFGKVNCVTLGHRQTVDDAVSILSTIVLGDKPETISPQAEKTVTALTSETVTVNKEELTGDTEDIVDINQKACPDNCGCQPFDCKIASDEINASLEDSGEPVVPTKEDIAEWESIVDAEKAETVITETDGQINTDNDIVADEVVSEESVVAEESVVSEDIKVVTYAGTQKKATKKMIAANKEALEFASVGDKVWIDGNKLTAYQPTDITKVKIDGFNEGEVCVLGTPIELK